MFLSIDVGNTNTTLGLLQDGEVHHRWRLKTDHADTPDELNAKLRSFLAMRGFSVVDIDASAIASVVPILSEAWLEALEDALESAPTQISAAFAKDALEIAMPYPEQVGADRIANAIEARVRYGAPAIVVDFGTATNIDVVDAKGRYRGGCIAPGLMLSASALFSRAAKLASIPITTPPNVIGNSTEHALQAGLVLGAAAQAEGLVERIKAQLADEAEQLARADEAYSPEELEEVVAAARKEALDCPVIATGGLASTVDEASEVFDAVDQDLTLRGIWRLCTRN